MIMSFLRVLGGILAGVAVIAGLWALAWNHPRLAGGLMLGAVGAAWGCFIGRSFSTGRVRVRGHYQRSKSPVAYWGWLGFYLLVGIYLIVGGTYALIVAR
jgi:hypothetical protein